MLAVVLRSAAPRQPAPRSGFTMIEILVTTVLSLMILGAVVSLFGFMGRGVNDARAGLEMTDRLRAVEAKLQNDLKYLSITSGGADLTASPPADPMVPKGYFEYTEGPIGPVRLPSEVARDTDTGGNDTTVGDIDDTLQFTVQAPTGEEPYVGRVLIKRYPRPGEPREGNDAPTPWPAAPDPGDYCVIRAASSQQAEVAWFLRGTTLYRRVLLVLDSFDADLRLPGPQMQLNSTAPYAVAASPGDGFYNNYDVAVCRDRSTGNLRPATLGDLTMPEYRFAHRPLLNPTLPPTPLCHPRTMMSWGTTSGSGAMPPFGLPTLVESSATDWPTASVLPSFSPTYASFPAGSFFDAWRNRFPWQIVDHRSGNFSAYSDPALPNVGSRLAEDIILTNVLSFDVKIWDAGAPLMRQGSVVLLPGDPGYATALRDYMETPGGATRPVGYGAFVDLNYMARRLPLVSTGNMWSPWTDASKPAATPDPVFNGPGLAGSGLQGNAPFLDSAPPEPLSAVFDTWTRQYDAEAGGTGMIDGNWICPPPYLEPSTLEKRIKAIQVKIRVFEPGSRQIREVTVVHKF